MAQRFFDKASLVEAAITTSSLPETCCVIGDRAADVAAAKDNNLHAVGVTWGYGGRDELMRAGADALVDSAPDLVDYIRRVTSA
jgi:phosphoglycolate phosphatase